MLKVKRGVKPKILVIAAAAINAAIDKEWDVVITSGNDSTHMVGSKHYSWEALDLRTFNIPPAELSPYITRLQDRLGPDYQVILEKDHIHVEYDPQPMI